MAAKSDPKLPVDVTAEQQLIAFALSDPFGRGELLAAVKPGAFASPSRGMDWRAMKAVAGEHGAVNLLDSLAIEWLRHNDPDAEASIAALQEARTVEVPIDLSGTVRAKLAETVNRLALQRHLIEVQTASVARLYQRNCDPLREAERMQEEIAERVGAVNGHG